MAMRTVPLKLGLISTTVKVATATEDTTPKFQTICTHEHDPIRVKQTLACPECSNADRGTFKKGLPQADGTIVVVDPEQLKEAGEVSDDVKNTITLTAHPTDDVMSSTMANGKVYYLEPNKGEHDNYALMVELVSQRSDVAFCSSFAVRGVPSMYRVSVINGALCLTQLAWPDSIKPAPQHTGKVDEAMLGMASQFVDTLMAPYSPETYQDDRSKQLLEFLSKQEAVASGEKDTVQATSGDDLMAALQAAIAPPKKKTATRKRTTKKAAA